MTTCQLCGRAIKAERGWIAHHGYRRPGSGWQTSSCPGARERPYEVSRDAIPPHIKAVRQMIKTTREILRQFEAKPPTTMRYEQRDIYGVHRCPPMDVPRPEGFSSATRPDYKPASYVTLYLRRLGELRQRIEGGEADLVYLRERYDAWVAP